MPFVWYCFKGLQNIHNIFEGNFCDVIARFIFRNIGPEILLDLHNDRQPVEGAKVTIECGDPPQVFTAVEQSEGTYIFKDAISVPHDLECELIAEKDG